MKGKHSALLLRMVYVAQLTGTLLILAWVPSNIGKAVTLIVWWLLTFGRLDRAEVALFSIACIFFSAMNVLALRQGVFFFRNPDWLGMPAYEFFMWGFYLLHGLRMLGGPAPNPSKSAWALALLYAGAFAIVSDAITLFAVTAALLLVALARFHQPQDLAYTGYLVLLGALVEYTGVHSGLWGYPEPPPGGVPLWFVTLWGGVGLFLRRLALPMLARFGHDNSPRVHGTSPP